MWLPTFLLVVDMSSPSLANRLATACYRGDMVAAKAALADGASVNEAGSVPGWGRAEPPLVPAVYKKHYDTVVWLLSHGANTNGVLVMADVAGATSSDVLQVLIDVGGDVNRHGGGWPPLFKAILHSLEANGWVLLGQPSLDVDVANGGNTAEWFARVRGFLALADAIVEEVSGSQREVFSVLRFTVCSE